MKKIGLIMLTIYHQKGLVSIFYASLICERPKKKKEIIKLIILQKVIYIFK